MRSASTDSKRLPSHLQPLLSAFQMESRHLILSLPMRTYPCVLRKRSSVFWMAGRFLTLSLPLRTHPSVFWIAFRYLNLSLPMKRYSCVFWMACRYLTLSVPQRRLPCVINIPLLLVLLCQYKAPMATYRRIVVAFCILFVEAERYRVDLCKCQHLLTGPKLPYMANEK